MIPSICVTFAYLMQEAVHRSFNYLTLLPHRETFKTEAESRTTNVFPAQVTAYLFHYTQEMHPQQRYRYNSHEIRQKNMTKKNFIWRFIHVSGTVVPDTPRKFIGSVNTLHMIFQNIKLRYTNSNKQEMPWKCCFPIHSIQRLKQNKTKQKGEGAVCKRQTGRVQKQQKTK